MTSKETLNELINYIGRLGGGETQEEEDIILRDLEVLEILKEIIKDQYDNNLSGWIEFCIDDSWKWWEQDEKETLKAKKLWEWINDK